MLLGLKLNDRHRIPHIDGLKDKVTTHNQGGQDWFSPPSALFAILQKQNKVNKKDRFHFGRTAN